MLTLLVREDAKPSRAFIPRAPRGLGLRSRLPEDLLSFDESEEDELFEYESDLEPYWSDSESADHDLAHWPHYLELSESRRIWSFVPGTSTPASRKRRFSSDSETSRA